MGLLKKRNVWLKAETNALLETAIVKYAKEHDCVNVVIDSVINKALGVYINGQSGENKAA